MNKSAFLKLIKQVSDISDQQQSELEQVAATFPYCQTAHLLLAKSAYDKGSMLSTQRLRRASAYATDRQLLKKLIYASPVLEPVYIDDPEIPEESATATLPIPADTQESTPVQAADPVDATATVEQPHQATNIETEREVQDTIPETPTSGTAQTELAEEADSLIPVDAKSATKLEVAPETEPLDQVYSHTSAENAAYSEQETGSEDDTENPEAEIDSELALLFTFSSISSSSTDLLRRRDDETGMAEQQEAYSSDGIHLSESAEALHDQEEAQDVDQDKPTSQAIPDTSLPQEASGILASEENASDVEELPFFEDDSADEITAPEASVPTAEDAEINYSFDEIDRLYAEDTLGYWMGSSRMGEVLQLKDDYTRQRPQSFHPELILEYSKTHELEKAIQPTTHVLSRQLDIIDQFLKLNPKLKTMANLKLKPEPQEDLSLKSSKIKKGMASESLANIFLKQGKPKKAVKIYEQLILKYPEKKSYFAEQIEKLQNIT